jgi:hypothetical protein
MWYVSYGGKVVQIVCKILYKLGVGGGGEAGDDLPLQGFLGRYRKLGLSRKYRARGSQASLMWQNSHLHAPLRVKGQAGTSLRYGFSQFDSHRK